MTLVRLTKSSRWRAKQGSSFFFVTFRSNEPDMLWARLFDTRRAADFWTTRRGVFMVARGRVTFKKTYCWWRDGATGFVCQGWR